MPTIPAILFTPVCPHSLSFRPLLLHANTTLRLEVPLDARSTPSISFDGKDTMSLARGDAVEISRAPSPLLLFDHDGGLDFVNGLRTKLNWNVRENQKPFNHISSLVSSSAGSGDCSTIRASAGGRCGNQRRRTRSVSSDTEEDPERDGHRKRPRAGE